MKNILETKCVTKTFKGQMALDGVSLQVPERCVYGLLGPNGAGKSTILKMLTGIWRPTSGKVIFDGHPWSRKDLADTGKKKAGAFSLGMKQRLGLGIALINRPKLLILDVNWGKGFGCV